MYPSQINIIIMSDLFLYTDLYDYPLTEKEDDFSAKPKITGTVRNAVDGTETLITGMPIIVEGDYYVKVTTQYARSGQVKDSRSYQYPLLLSVPGDGDKPEEL